MENRFSEKLRKFTINLAKSIEIKGEKISISNLFNYKLGQYLHTSINNHVER